MSRFWSDTVRALAPYTPGEQPAGTDLLKLNTNEHAEATSDNVMRAIRDLPSESLRRYPDPDARELRAAIAEVEAVGSERVFVGNGSDEVLAHAWQAFLSHRPVASLDVTYGFYPVWAQLYGSDYQEIPVRADFSVDVAALSAAEAALVLANPNAPTALSLNRDVIETIVHANPERLVVVDEAYFGFGSETSAPLAMQYDNVLVTRSLSKSHALAGLRVGYAIGHPDLIEGLQRVKDSFNSYPIDAVAQAAACAAIRDVEWFEGASARLCESRQVLCDGLIALGFEVLPSSANFVFLRHPRVSGEALFSDLRERGVLVRRWDRARIRDWLRISIGRMDQSERLLSELASVLGV